MEGRDGSKDERNDGGEQDEEQVPRLGARDVGHDEEDGEIDDGLSHVGLQDDEPDGEEHDHQAQQETGQLADAASDPREIRREEEDRPDLHELRRLDADLGEAQPRAGAVHGPADDERDEEQEEADAVDVDGKRAERGVAEEGEEDHEAEAGHRPDDLAHELPRGLGSRRIDAAGIDEEDADDDEDERGAAQDEVEGSKRELPQSMPPLAFTVFPGAGMYQGCSAATASS